MDQLTPHQHEQLQVASSGQIGTLIGAAGTGKTTVTAHLIRQHIHAHGTKSTLVCAPTGKAAVRATEAINYRGVRAKTIHSALESVPTKYGWTFLRDEDTPLDAGLIIVDEASMVDVSLLASLLSAVRSDAKVLLVGDDAQLQPVGRGKPLHDMIAAGLPTGRLTEIHRNAGTIAHIANKIRTGSHFQCPPPEKFVELGGNDNLVLLDADKPDEQIERMLKAIRACGDHWGLDPIWDIQVLTARRDKGPLSRHALNDLLADELNLQAGRSSNRPFRAGDKIMCLSNGLYKTNNGGQRYVANGEVGQVIQVQPHYSIVFLDGPEPRTVQAWRSRGRDWELAFASTVHKFQGSEIPVGIVMLDASASSFVDRTWLYTAITRAKQYCFVIGDEADLRLAARLNGPNKRKTFLTELITEKKEPNYGTT